MEEKLVEEQEEKTNSKIKWFFMVVLVPSIFALAVVMVVASVAGVNVYEKAMEVKESIPFLSSSKEETKESNNEREDKLTALNEAIKEYKSTIADLQKEVDSKDKAIQKLELEKKQLEQELSALENNQSDDNNEFKNIVKTYETMSAKKAAPIITQMNDKEALQILSVLKPNTLASILEQMNATDAAKYTTLLSETNE
jgi:flagellar motility protein MotE (MotC chaperone)